jgi:hypothetical protein
MKNNYTTDPERLVEVTKTISKLGIKAAMPRANA